MDKVNNDLISLVESDLGPGRKHGRWVLWHCPFHADHTPSLAVTNGDGNRGPYWQCFAASCGKHGGVKGWLVDYRGLSPEAAHKMLSQGKIERSQGATCTNTHIAPPDTPPGSAWQERAWEIVQHAQAALWGEAGQEPVSWEDRDPRSGGKELHTLSALDWLKERGFTEDTLRIWHIGYVPMTWCDPPEKWGVRGKAVWISQGILIPSMLADQVWYLKIRRPNGHPKYIQVRHSQPALYMAQTLEFHESVVFCEGELDALLLWQEAGDLTAVVTLGSAGTSLSTITWGFHLLNTRTRYLAYDADEAGETGGGKLAWLNTQRLEIPRLRPFDKDLTDYYRSGGSLRSWMQAIMKNGSAEKVNAA